MNNFIFQNFNIYAFYGHFSIFSLHNTSILIKKSILGIMWGNATPGTESFVIGVGPLQHGVVFVYVNVI